MKKTNSLLFVLMLTFFWCHAFAQSGPSITTFILVRHAEKANDGTTDPTLSAEGNERAKRLTALLQKTDIAAVYSTRYNRTRSTVTPIAQEKGLEVQVYEPGKTSAIEKMLSDHAGKTVLVGGHSNTIPAIANQLLGREEFKNFDETDYGNLLIIAVDGNEKAGKVTWLRY